MQNSLHTLASTQFSSCRMHKYHLYWTISILMAQNFQNYEQTLTLIYSYIWHGETKNKIYFWWEEKHIHVYIYIDIRPLLSQTINWFPLHRLPITLFKCTNRCIYFKACEFVENCRQVNDTNQTIEHQRQLHTSTIININWA